MMASIMSYFGSRKDPKQPAREAIVTLREQLQMIEKKEEHLHKKIDDELKKARANALSNKAVATAALKRKKAFEVELDRLTGTRFQLEMQMNTLECVYLNAETLGAMKKASDALKVIHGKLTLDNVEDIMSDVNEQHALADEVAAAIASPMYGDTMDEDELKAELEELEQEELDMRLSETDHAPVHLPPGSVRQPEKVQAPADDEAAQLRELQASLAM